MRNLTWTGLATINGCKASNVTTHGEIVVQKFLAKKGPSGTYSHFWMSLAVHKRRILRIYELWLSSVLKRLNHWAQYTNERPTGDRLALMFVWSQNDLSDLSARILYYKRSAAYHRWKFLFGVEISRLRGKDTEEFFFHTTYHSNRS